jgi:plastocyanin
MRRAPRVVAAFAAGALALAFTVWSPVADAQTTTTIPAPKPCPTPADATVTLQNNAYNPAALTMPRAGMKVCFEHHDGATPHSVTFEPPTAGGVDSNPDCSKTNTAPCFHQGDTGFHVTFTTNGTYRYHCKIHDSMTGVITVGDGAAPIVTTTTKAPTTGGGATTTTAASTDTTVGAIANETTTTEGATSTTSSTLALTTQTTSSALGNNASDDDDEPSAVLKAIGVVLLAAVVAALIPSWRRLT